MSAPAGAISARIARLLAAEEAGLGRNDAGGGGVGAVEKEGGAGEQLAGRDDMDHGFPAIRGEAGELDAPLHDDVEVAAGGLVVEDDAVFAEAPPPPNF